MRKVNMEKKVKLFKGLILMGILTLAVSCQKQQKQQTGSSYKTMRVGLSNKTLYTNFSATIQGKQDVEVYPQISGLITQVCVNEGATVKQSNSL